VALSSNHIGMSPVVAAAHRFVHPSPSSAAQASTAASSPALSHAVSHDMINSSDSSSNQHRGRTMLFSNEDEAAKSQAVADRDEMTANDLHATPMARPRHGSAASVSLASAARRAPNAVVHASASHHVWDVAVSSNEAVVGAHPSSTRSPASAAAVTLSSAMTPAGVRAASQRYAHAGLSHDAASSVAATASAATDVGDSADEPSSPPLAMRFHTRPPPSYASMLRTAMAAAATESDEAPTAANRHAHRTYRAAFDDGDSAGEFDGDSARERSDQSYSATQSFFLPTPADFFESPARLAPQRESTAAASAIASSPQSANAGAIAAATAESRSTPARTILGRTFLPSRSTPATAAAARAIRVATASGFSALDA
jgi:hypothetical protein